MRSNLTKALTAALLFIPLALAAQEMGDWRAVSSNARSITGDAALTAQKLYLNFVGFTMVQVRVLEKPEIAAAFDIDSNEQGSGSLYRLNVPAAQKFLHKNSLCGGEDTHWMVTYVAGHNLRLAFFSGQAPPVFTLDAISNSTELCGTFTYAK